MHPAAKKLQKRRSGASAAPAHGGHGPTGWPPAQRSTAAPGGHPAARPRNIPRFRLPQGPFGTPAAAVLQARPTRGRKTAVAQRVARQAEGRNNPRRQPASGPAGHRPTRCPRQHHPTPPSRPKMASHTRPQCIFCPKDLPVLHICCNFVPQIQHHLIWNNNDSQLIARQARHYLRRAQ